MIETSDVDYCVKRLVELCAIPSPSGFTERAERFLVEAITKLKLKAVQNRKKVITCDLGGTGRPLALAAHVDTLGAMVRSVKESGRLRLTRIGGYPELYVVGSNCVVHTRRGREFSGTIQPVNPASHVNRKLAELKPDEDSLEIVLDVVADTKDEVLALGVSPGDFVSLDPRTVVTDTGYVKSRHLDDKASSAILLALAGAVSRGALRPSRQVYLLFTMYEEVGHGGSAGVPDEVEEVISVDMGVVGDDLSANDRQVSICAKDSGGPYDYEVTNALVEAADRAGADYVLDIYPYYGSDVEAALRAGYDIKHGLIGPGVSASHGYERTHRDALTSTLKLLAAYIG